jgi:hypothetical protein
MSCFLLLPQEHKASVKRSFVSLHFPNLIDRNQSLKCPFPSIKISIYYMRGSASIAPPFLTSAVVGGACSASRPTPLYLWGNHPRYPLDRRLNLNVIFQHPVALCRSDIGVSAPSKCNIARCSIIGPCFTKCFGLNGHLQVKRLL